MQISEELYMKFEKFLERDEDGWVVGISEDATLEAKEAYVKFQKIRLENGTLEEE